MCNFEVERLTGEPKPFAAIQLQQTKTFASFMTLHDLRKPKKYSQTAVGRPIMRYCTHKHPPGSAF